MAISPNTVCRTPGCYAIAAPGNKGLCLKCLPLPKPTKEDDRPEQVKKHDYHREWHDLYNDKRWCHKITGLRACTLRRDPVCVVCKRYPSTIADHKEDHRGNTAKFFDPANVRGVCKGCHDAKTGSQHGKGDRTPPKQGLQDGKVLDHGTQVDDDNSIPDFDFTKKPIEPKEE